MNTYWADIEDHLLAEDYICYKGTWTTDELALFPVAWDVVQGIQTDIRVADYGHATHYVKSCLQTVLWHMNLKGTDKRVNNKYARFATV